MMTTTSGIRAGGQECVNKIVLKDADCRIVVIRAKVAPTIFGLVVVDGALTNQAEITKSRAKLKD